MVGEECVAVEIAVNSATIPCPHEHGEDYQKHT